MNEIWSIIDEFPRYQVSDLGRVMNVFTGRIISLSRTRTGCVKVGLYHDDNVQHQKSVKLLVAEAFVEGRTDIFDTPIHLDGDQDNCMAINIVWRPRWFAWRYTNQFRNISPYYKKRRVVDVETGEVYRNVYEAAMQNGLLFKDIWRSINSKEPIFPTWQKFELVR